MTEQLPVLLDLTTDTPPGIYRFDTIKAPGLPESTPGMISVARSKRFISHCVVMDGAVYSRIGRVPEDGGPAVWQPWEVRERD